jgi:hypothetical protein
MAENGGHDKAGNAWPGIGLINSDGFSMQFIQSGYEKPL